MSDVDLLAELLSELFEEDDLRKFVRGYRSGRAVLRLLADEDDLDGVEEIAYFVVQQWDERGLIDGDLQDRLVNAHPDYEQSIAEVFDELLDDNFDEFDEFEDDDEDDEDDEDDLDEFDVDEEEDDDYGFDDEAAGEVDVDEDDEDREVDEDDEDADLEDLDEELDF